MRTKRALVVLILAWALASHLLSQGSSKNSKSNPSQLPAARTLRIAIVQMHSFDHDIDGNLKRATKFSEQGAAQGARLVLFPELTATGSYLSFETWDSAESRNGKTVQWMKSNSRRLHIYVGAGFFEADGEDFYDTFVLTTPEGEEAGRVRKAVPAEAKAYFFRGYDNPHVINTAIGRIGIGICAENYYCQLPTQLIKRSADIILMPHAAPDMSGSGGLPQPPGTRLASWYARKLGIPVAMVNKVGRSYKPPPNGINAFFPGLSAIVDSDGTVKRSMDNKEGVAVADVVLDPARKKSPEDPPVCTGIGIADLTIGGEAGKREVAQSQALGKESYDSNPARKAKALAISENRDAPAPLRR